MVARFARRLGGFVLVLVLASLSSCGSGSTEGETFEQPLHRWLPGPACSEREPIYVEVESDECDTALMCVIRPEDGAAFYSTCWFDTDWPLCPEALEAQVFQGGLCD